MVHDKFHSSNHHTLSAITPNQPDSGLDSIASAESPFQGNFVLSGTYVSVQGKNTSAGVIECSGVAASLSGEYYSFDAVGDYINEDNIEVDTISLTNAVISLNRKSTILTGKVLYVGRAEEKSCFRLWEIDENHLQEYLPPRFILQPKLQYEYLDTHSTAILECNVQNSSNIAYQWYYNNNPIGNATSRTLTITLRGMYYVVATNTAGSTYSTNVVLLSAPEAHIDIFTVPPEQTITLDVKSNDTIRLPSTIVSYTQPMNGRLLQVTATDVLNYTPFASYPGHDMFTYTVKDIAHRISTATVILSCVVIPCSASGETIYVQASATYNIDLNTVITPGTLNYALISNTRPRFGNLTLNYETKIATYWSPFIQHNYDYFTYTIQDAANNTSTATIILTSE